MVQAAQIEKIKARLRRVFFLSCAASEAYHYSINKLVDCTRALAACKTNDMSLALGCDEQDQKFQEQFLPSRLAVPPAQTFYREHHVLVEGITPPN